MAYVIYSMQMLHIYIIVSTILFTLLSFTMPVPTVYYWGYRGACIILAIVGWLLTYQIYFK